MENNFLFVKGPDRPMSLLEISELYPLNFHSRGNGGYLREKFVREDKVYPGWNIIMGDHVPGSTNSAMIDQTELLLAQEHVPNVAEIAWMIITYKAVIGVFLLNHVLVCTSSVDSNGNPIVVGRFDEDGMIIRSWKNHDKPDGAIGIIAARRQ